MSETVQSVTRALQILEILRGHPAGLGVTEIATDLKVTKSTAHRLLASLLEKEFVAKEELTGKYRLGLKLLQLGGEVEKSMDVREIANPYLIRLVELTGETAHLAIYDKGEIVYIDKIESSATLRMYSQVGLRAPIHCTGLGKAMSPFIPENEIEYIIKTKGLPKFTENTITTMHDFIKAMEEIRTRGYSFDDEEHEYGIRCAAAPIFKFEKKLVAGISVAGPITRISQERMKELGILVKEISLEISKKMGY